MTGTGFPVRGIQIPAVGVEIPGKGEEIPAQGVEIPGAVPRPGPPASRGPTMGISVPAKGRRFPPAGIAMPHAGTPLPTVWTAATIAGIPIRNGRNAPPPGAA
jgi:hypothetical protein